MYYYVCCSDAVHTVVIEKSNQLIVYVLITSVNIDDKFVRNDSFLLYWFWLKKTAVIKKIKCPLFMS